MVKNNKYHFVIRFIGIYLCVLLPLLVAGLVVINRIVDKSKTKIEQEMENSVKRTEMALEQRKNIYHDDAILLFSNEELLPRAIKENIHDAKTSIRILKNLWMFDSTSIIYASYYGDGFLYYYSGLESVKTFFETTLSCTADSCNDAEKALASEKEDIRFLCSKNNEVNILYHMPVGRDGYGYLRSLEVIDTYKSYGDVLRGSIMEEDCIVQMTTDSQELWMSFQDGKMKVISDKEAMFLIKENDLENSASHLSDVSINICIWYNPAQVLEEYYVLRNLCVLLLSVGFLVSAVVSIMLSMTRARGMDRLVKSLNEKKAADTWKTRSEYGFLQSLVNIPLRELDALHIDKRNYQQKLNRETSGLIFHGCISRKDEALSMIKACEISLNDEFFYLCGMRLSSMEECEKLESLLFGEMHYSYQDSSESIILVVLQVIPCRDKNGRFRKRAVAALKNRFSSVGISQDIIIVSRVYDSVIRSHYAYYEVISALDDKAPKKGIILWEDWIGNKVSTEDIAGLKCIDLFQSSLEHGEINAVMDIVHEIDSIIKGDRSREYARYLLLQSVIIEIGRRKYEDLDSYKLQLENINLRDSSVFEQEMGDILKELLRNPEKSFEQILSYINENCYSDNLSLDIVAEYGNMSKSNLSRQFYSQMGIHYLEYITELRMNRAADMIRRTNLDIREVFQSVGYNDYTNASKNFKKKFGMKPSEYRILYKESEDNV